MKHRSSPASWFGLLPLDRAGASCVWRDATGRVGIQATPTASSDGRHLRRRSALDRGDPGARRGQIERDRTDYSRFLTGDAADPATTAAITAMLQEMAACLTAGDMLRFYALHSDDWLQRSLGIVDGMAILTISIPHARRRESRALPGSLARADPARWPGPGGGAARRQAISARSQSHESLLFVHRDGRWLVDETIASVRVPTARSRSRSPRWSVRHRGPCSTVGRRRAAS